MLVLLSKARERSALEGVLLHVRDAAFHLALVARGSWLRGEHGRAIVPAELLELRIDRRIEPVCLQDSRLEVVDDQGVRHAPKVLERVLHALNEVVGRLGEDGLAVTASRVGEHDADDVRPPSLAVGADHDRTGPEVDLGLEAWRALHPTERCRQSRSVLLQEPPDAVVADFSSRWELGLQILMDPLSRQALLPLLEKPGQPGARPACLALGQAGRRGKTSHCWDRRRLKTVHPPAGPGRRNRRNGRF
jgi:hypothetical protein